MANRKDIIKAVKDILEETKWFYNVYEEPTDIEKERSFPVAWINLGPELVQDADMSQTCYLRIVNLDITIATHHLTTDQNLNELIDKVFDLMRDKYRLNGVAINLTPTEVVTDRGYLHPYALATLLYKVWIR